jgi:hypothetical protein
MIKIAETDDTYARWHNSRPSEWHIEKQVNNIKPNVYVHRFHYGKHSRDFNELLAIFFLDERNDELTVLLRERITRNFGRSPQQDGLPLE